MAMPMTICAAGRTEKLWRRNVPRLKKNVSFMFRLVLCFYFYVGVLQIRIYLNTQRFASS